MDIKTIMEYFKKAYSLTDEVIKNILETNNIKTVCSSGCSVCCEDMALSVLPQEIEIIKYHIRHLTDKSLKEKLYRNISLFTHDQPGCPFLIDKKCGVYEVRPLTCRVYYIKNKKCVLGEDIIRTRFHDMVRFRPENLIPPLTCLYPVYGYKDEQSFLNKLNKGFMQDHIIDLYNYDMKSIIQE